MAVAKAITTLTNINNNEDNLNAAIDAFDDALKVYRSYDAKRLIGQKFNDSKVQEDMKHFPFNIKSNNKSKSSSFIDVSEERSVDI